MADMNMKCDADGCLSAYACRHPRDPKCRRSAPRTCETINCIRIDAHPTSACESVDGRRLVQPSNNLKLDSPTPLGFTTNKTQEAVDHPNHYDGDTTYETIKVIAAWNLGFLIGNCVKYLSRAGKKDPSKLIEDLKKGRWYLDKAIETLEAGGKLF